MGILCAATGLILGWWVQTTAPGSGYESFPVASLIGGFLAGSWLWHMRMSRFPSPTWRRAASTGALIAFLGHYLCWYVLIIVQNIFYWFGGRCAGSLGEAPIDPLTGLLGAAGLAVVSLLFLGWLTIPVGILLGLLVLALDRQPFFQTDGPDNPPSVET